MRPSPPHRHASRAHIGDVPRVRVHPSEERQKDILPGSTWQVLRGVHDEPTCRDGIRRVGRRRMAGQLWERAEDGQVEGRGNPWSSQDDKVDMLVPKRANNYHYWYRAAHYWYWLIWVLKQGQTDIVL